MSPSSQVSKSTDPYSIVNGIARRSLATELIPDKVKKIANLTTIKSAQEFKNLKSQITDQLKATIISNCQNDECLKELKNTHSFSIEDATNTFIQ